jgi:hypothetical protein
MEWVIFKELTDREQSEALIRYGVLIAVKQHTMSTTWLYGFSDFQVELFHPTWEAVGPRPRVLSVRHLSATLEENRKFQLN